MLLRYRLMNLDGGGGNSRQSGVDLSQSDALFAHVSGLPQHTVATGRTQRWPIAVDFPRLQRRHRRGSAFRMVVVVAATLCDTGAAVKR